MDKFDSFMNNVYEEMRVVRWSREYADGIYIFGSEIQRLIKRWGLDDIFPNNTASSEEVEQLISPEYRKSIADHLEYSVKTHRKYDVFYPLDLQYVGYNIKIWVHSVGSHEYDLDGRLIRTIGMLQDVTINKQMELNFHQKKAELKQAQDIGNLGHWSFQDGMFYLSDNLSRILDINLSNMLSFDEFINLVDPDYLDVINGEFYESLINRQETEFNFKVKLSSGKEKYIHCIVKIEESNLAHEANTFGVMQDISYIKQTQLELIKAKESAEKSDYLKSVFLANMSHEIRTPLNSIVGFSSILADKDLKPEKKQKYGEIIKKSSAQLETLISDIIDISKIESGNIQIEKSPLSINETLKEIASIFKGNEESTKLKLQVDYCPNNDLELVSDRSRFIQILSNLISNAFKFTKEGVIKFGVKNIDESMICFYVSDTGVGIAEDVQKIIFNRFRQGEEGPQRKFEGTGLGLSICKSLVHLLGGTIWVESEENMGSTFSFELPFKSSASKQKKESLLDIPQEEIGGFLKGKKVLIVDDNEDIHYFLEQFFEDAGAECENAYNGLMAVKFCELDNFDLVLMDVQMPQMDGLEATKIIKKSKPQIPIIVQTAFALMGDRERFMESGANGYITKPIDLVKLETIISNVFDEMSILYGD